MRNLVRILIIAFTFSGGLLHALEIDVDCSQGDSFESALTRATFRGLFGSQLPILDEPTVINVSGTCVGNFEVRSDHLTIRGTPGASAVLEGVLDAQDEPVGPVVDARAVRGLHLENLTVRQGTIGLLAIAADGGVENCLFENNEFGLFILDSRVFSIGSTDVLNNLRDGIYIDATNTVGIYDVEIAGNGDSGLFVYRGQVYLDDGCFFHDNDSDDYQTQVVVADHSEMEINATEVNSVIIQGWLVVAAQSYVESFGSAAGSIRMDYVHLTDSGDAFLWDTEVGEAWINHFSHLVLRYSRADLVNCYGASSDAACDNAEVPDVVACPSVLSGSCVPPSGDSASPIERPVHPRRPRTAVESSVVPVLREDVSRRPPADRVPSRKAAHRDRCGRRK